MRSKKHILALNESFEIVDIWICWQSVINEFPGLLPKIRDPLRKGPVLREGENPKVRSTSNKPRNDAFVYLLAGKLLMNNKNLICVDGIGRHGTTCNDRSDIIVECNKLKLIIECKRPNSEGALEERTKIARRQIGEHPGIIAIDCSSVVRPPGTVIERESDEIAERFLGNLLENNVKPKIERHLRPNLLGFILYARVPAMTPIGHSRIVNVSGSPLEIRYRPGSISTVLLIENSDGDHIGVLASIFSA